MLAGAPPFSDSQRNGEKMKMLILRNRPEFPSDFSPDAINLITSFL